MSLSLLLKIIIRKFCQFFEHHTNCTLQWIFFSIKLISIRALSFELISVVFIFNCCAKLHLYDYITICLPSVLAQAATTKSNRWSALNYRNLFSENPSSWKVQDQSGSMVDVWRGSLLGLQVANFSVSTRVLALEPDSLPFWIRTY